MNVIAWAYMVELESGLTTEQTRALLDLVPPGAEVIPFHLDEDSERLEANSFAAGFILSEHFEALEAVKEELAAVCNDWENELPDHIYPIESEDSSEPIAAMMLCDSETISF